MPTRPGKICRQPGCSNIAKAGQYNGYCEQHKDKGNWSRREDQAGSTTKRGYGAYWRKLRDTVIRRDRSICQSCGKCTLPGNQHVDHIKPKAKGGSNELNNLQLLCESCHGQKTARE